MRGLSRIHWKLLSPVATLKRAKSACINPKKHSHHKNSDVNSQNDYSTPAQRSASFINSAFKLRFHSSGKLRSADPPRGIEDAQSNASSMSERRKKKLSVELHKISMKTRHSNQLSFIQSISSLLLITNCSGFFNSLRNFLGLFPIVAINVHLQP